MEESVYKIRRIGETFSENMIITIFISLPSSYAHFIFVWEYPPQESSTLSIIISRLVLEEEYVKKTESLAFAAYKDYACLICGTLSYFKA